MNIMVASHPRSGTHLVIQTIVKALGLNEGWQDVPIGEWDREIDIEAILNVVETYPDYYVTKTHHSAKLVTFDGGLPDWKIVYVYRNPMDTLRSLWKYLGEPLPFWEFIHSKPKDVDADTYSQGVLGLTGMTYIERWGAHVSGWLSLAPKVHPVAYEHLLLEPEKTTMRLMEFLTGMAIPMSLPEGLVGVRPDQGIIGASI